MNIVYLYQGEVHLEQKFDNKLRDYNLSQKAIADRLTLTMLNTGKRNLKRFQEKNPEVVIFYVHYKISTDSFLKQLSELYPDVPVLVDTEEKLLDKLMEQLFALYPKKVYYLLKNSTYQVSQTDPITTFELRDIITNGYYNWYEEFETLAEAENAAKERIKTHIDSTKHTITNAQKRLKELEEMYAKYQ